MRISLRWISSSLCNVARLTVLPLTNTGSSAATGVRIPVRPTWTLISSNFVSTRSAAYLYAIAHRGDLAVKPSCSRCTSASTLITAPSVSYRKSCRTRSSLRIASRIFSTESASHQSSCVGRPSFLNKGKTSEWRSTSAPSIAPVP